MGGVASGKTTVAEMLGSLGAKVINADKIGHSLLNSPEIKEKLVRRWGREILDEEGKVDRTRLSTAVFSDKEELKELNNILHPPILKAIEEEIASDKSGTVVLDAALLQETGLTEVCDLLVFVAAEDRVKKERAVRDRKWNPDEVIRREGLQSPLEEKRRIAHYVINNNSTRDKTLEQVKDFWNSFVT